MPLFALSQLFSVLDRKWTSSTSKLSKLTPKFWKLWPFLKNTSNSLWVASTPLPFDKTMSKFPTLSGRILEDYKKPRSSYKK